MADVVILTCLYCDVKLEITAEIERFACSNCGNEYVVKRGGGIVSIIPTAEIINKQNVMDINAAGREILELVRENDRINQDTLTLSKDILRKYEEKFWGVKTIPHIFISYLLDKKDGRKFAFFDRQEDRARVYKERMYALSIEDLEYLTEKARYEAVKPSTQNDQEYIKFFDDLQLLKKLIRENNYIVQKNVAEINRLKQLVSQ